MKLVAFLIIISLVAGKANAAEVKLGWDAHPDPTLDHYTLYQAELYAHHSGPWQKVKEIEKALTAVTVTVEDGKDFTWYVTATNLDSVESGPSNTVRLFKPKPIEKPTCLDIF